MGDKNRKAGLLVGGIFISLALVFLLISIGIKHISVIKNDTLSEKESVSSYTDDDDDKVDEDLWGTEGENEGTGNTSADLKAEERQGTDSENSAEEVDSKEGTEETSVESDTEVPSTDAKKESEGTVPDEKMVANNETSTGVNSWTEINESSIDYSVDERSTDGVVNSKKVYLTNEGTLVYCLGISCTIDGKDNALSYYCGYSAYNNVKKNDLVTVRYKEPTDNTILISRVEVN